jgi:hypothetical protein
MKSPALYIIFSQNQRYAGLWRLNILKDTVMTQQDDEWNPDFDDGQSTIWAAEWFGPEEKIEDEAELSKLGVHVIYDGKQHYTWYYPQVHAALTQDKVREFIEYEGITGVSDEDVEELKAFFYHWIRFTMFEVDVEQGPREFVPEGINEVLGDEDVSEITVELERAGMKKKYEELFNSRDDKPSVGPVAG